MNQKFKKNMKWIRRYRLKKFKLKITEVKEEPADYPDEVPNTGVGIIEICNNISEEQSKIVVDDKITAAVYYDRK